MPARTIRSATLAALLLAALPVAAAGSLELRPAPVAIPESPAPVWTAKQVELDRLLVEDVARAAAAGLPLRVTVAEAVNLDPSAAGHWARTAEGLSWTIELHAAEARWISLNLGSLELPQGARLTGSTPDGAIVATRRAGDEARIPQVDGDRLRLELFVPDGVDLDRVVLELGTLIYGARDVRGSAAAVVGECHVDVACPLGDALRDERRGIVRMQIPIAGGTFRCTGSLINTTAGDCSRPYVLTADHCYTEDPTASMAGTVFTFNYELPACAGGQASDVQVVVGASLVASRPESDFRLLELNTAPPSEWRPFYNGWDRSSSAPGSASTIHHPSGDVKKISHDTGPVINGQVFVSHWRVSNYEAGVTETGSSGSPLLDSDGRIVGQLNIGSSSCGNPGGWDEYGRFDVSWSAGSSAATRLSDSLDPLGTGAMTLDGLDQAACDAGTRPAFGSAVVVDDLGNDDGRLDPGEIATIQVALANIGVADATAVSATLDSSDPRVTIRQATATWPDLPGLAAGTISDAPHFRVELDSSAACGESVPLSLTIDGAQGSWTDEFSLPTGLTIDKAIAFTDDIESGDNGWTAITLPSGNPWLRTTGYSLSGATSWFVAANLNGRDSILSMPIQSALPAGARLGFWHDLVSDNGFDGGVVELSANGGEWVDAAPYFVTGGYNGGISLGFSSALEGRSAWTGDTVGWQRVVVDLSSFEGVDLEVRWRFATDQLIGSRGWYIDDVTIDHDVRSCPFPYVNLLPGARCSGAVEPRDPSRPGRCSPRRERPTSRPSP